MADSYYRPYYPSDSESEKSDGGDSVASYDSWGAPSTPERPSNADPLTSEELPVPDFSAFARGLQEQAKALVESAGPTFETSEREIFFGTRQLRARDTYGPVDFQISKQKDISGSILQAAKLPAKDLPTVIMLQSKDRDRSVFAQPTLCELYLPRIYKNINSFSVTQINLTSAFFYFRADKENITIQIQEKDRILYDPVTSLPVLDASGNTTPLKITTTINVGSYNIDQLLAQLQTQLNRTPIFYDFINGFADFYPLFVINGDYALNFNYPGDNYYDAVQRIFINNPTTAQITGFYFQTQFANLASYSIDQVRVAYYYPVLKEAVLDPTTVLTDYNLTYGSLTQEEVIQYLVYNFTGINDIIATQIINQNLTQLDLYRILHTFRYALVNRYTCTYSQINNRVTIKSTSLNTSLVNLLNTQYNAYFATQLANFGITQAQYNALFATNANLLSIVQSMYDYLQVRLANNFAVNYGTYDRAYYTNADYEILIRNGLDASGIATSYNPAIVPYPRSSNLLLDYQRPPPYSWSRMTGLGDVQGPAINMGSVLDTYPTGSNFPYNVAASNIDLTRNFIDASGVIYTDARRKAGDILCDVQPGKYTIFKFRSAVRQTLQIEALPRQTIWRYPLWNKANQVPYPISSLFDISYSFVNPYALSNINYDLSFNAIYGWSNLAHTSNNFGTNFNTNLAYWGSNRDTITIQNLTGRYYTFTTPSPVDPLLASSNLYTYNVNVTFQSPPATTFPTDLYAFFYHDLSALNADVSGSRQESPVNYKQRLTIQTGAQSNTLSFTAYANQQYYLLVRPVSTTPAPTQYRIVPWFPNGSSNTQLSFGTSFNPAADPTTLLSFVTVAQNNDSNFIKLPIQSTIWSNTTPSNDFINTIVLNNPPKIGYDASGVSNDLTDYIPFSNNPISTINPSATICADPTNNFIFKFQSPYNSTLTVQSYFYTGSSNQLLTRNASNTYSWKSNTIPARQYKMVNYYGTTFLSVPGVKPYTSSDISPYEQHYTTATTGGAIGGYNYGGGNSALALGSGVCGFTLLPADGVWSIDRLMFKSNFISNDPNDQIQVLGVFLTAEIMAGTLGQANLTKALAICVKERKTVYTPTNQNLGFDASLGTYYTFSNISTLVTRSNAIFTGTSQRGKQLIPDSNSYYTVLAFTGLTQSYIATSNWSSLQTELSNAKITTIENMVGSPIPYPLANQPFVSSVFYDGQSTLNGRQLLQSTSNASPYGPASGYDQSVVQYQQSIPYVNSHMHFINPVSMTQDASGFNAWSNAPLTPSFLCATVPNTMLFQDGNFAIANYKTFGSVVPGPTGLLPDPERSFSNPTTTLTVDQIYPASETTSLVAVTGNSKAYVFLGLSNDQLRFKVFTPSTGILTELPINPNYTLTTSNHIVQKFVFNNSSNWFVSAHNTATNSIDLIGSITPYASNTSLTSYTYAATTQSDLQLDPSGANLYLGLGASYTSIYAISLTTFSQYGKTVNLQNSVGSLPAFYTQFAVTLNGSLEEVVLLSSAQPTRFFRIDSVTDAGGGTSNTTISRSVQTLPLAPTRIFGGAEGSKWILNPGTPYVMGNRNDAYDYTQNLDIAYQIFFPVLKVEMRKLASGATSSVDLMNLDYPEWPHSMMFAYSNLSTLMLDISANGGQWGLESNYMVSDVSFNSFYFGAYAMNVPLFPNANCNAANENAYYYLAVRGYLPTEGFQTMLRFSLPKRYDFGYVRIRDLSDEVLTIQTQGSNFSPNYSNALLSFNSNFVYTNRNFGSNSFTQLPGSNFSSSNFGQFLQTYSNLYNQYLSNSVILTTIQSNVNSNINNFIQTQLPYILPSSALTRQRFTDPLLFKILWKSALTPIFLTLEDDWGLGYNLGFFKRDTDFSTVHTGESFFKIQQDFIYLRLNPEFNINRVDAGGKENLSQTHEPSGLINQYYCKLLLTNFGGNATTFIHNPVTFNPPLNRLTKIRFEWYYPNGVQIDNADAEWSMTVNINEREFVNTIPDALQYTPNR